MHQCNWRGVVSDRIYRIPALPTQGTGPDVFGCLCRGTGSLFYCLALDVPFTDKGIQACRLKGSTAASGQSAVRRHTRASLGLVAVAVVVVVVVVVVVMVLFLLIGSGWIWIDLSLLIGAVLLIYTI